jgi:phosphoribosylformylglycinamidine synthase subunit PurS
MAAFGQEDAMTNVRVFVTLKRGVLDPAGKAVVSGLHQLGFPEVADARLGKLVELQIDAEPAQALERADQMCRKLLANLVIEDFRIEQVGSV